MDQVNHITQSHIPTAGQGWARREKRAGSPEPSLHKRCRLALEVQLSEVSEETCDVAAYLCSVDQAAAGGQASCIRRQGPQPKSSRLLGHQLNAAVGNSRSGTADPARAGPQATAQPQGCGASSTAMGPPAPSAPQTLPLGSLLVAAQMAAGAAADGSNAGLGRGNSPLLLTTQAALQATTASVVAAEVLAAVNRPGGIHSISAACAAPGVSAAALAGLLAGSLGPAGVAPVAQQKGLAGLTSCPADLPGPQTTPAQPQQPPAAGIGAAQDTPRAPESKAPTNRPGAAAPSAAAAAAEELASAQAAAVPAKLQVPSWLSEASPELKASQAICKASLDTATAALLRLSSPKALCPSSTAAAASAPAAAGHMGARSLPLAAFAAGPPALEAAGAAPATSLAVPALWGPSLLPSSPAAAPAPAVPAAVFGIPARDVAAGQGLAWGLPVGASAAAVAASSTAPLLSAQHQVAAAAAATTLACLLPVAVRREARAAESDTADAASCCSSPKAVAAGAGSAGDAATARLAAAALRLAAHSVELQPDCVSGVCTPRCSSSSAALTADDASSPAASEDGDAAVSGLLKAGAAQKSLGGPVAAAAVGMEEEAAVVVHVEVSRGKGSAAAAAVKQLTQLC